MWGHMRQAAGLELQVLSKGALRGASGGDGMTCNISGDV
jgi:hypothetical protein